MIRTGAEVAVAAMLASFLASCSTPEPAPGDALRERFPEVSARILEASRGFVGDSAGFTLPPHEGGALDVALPSAAEDAIRLRLGERFEVRVRESGAFGRAAQTGSAVAYRRAGGTSFWTAAGSGIEEWLHLAPGVAHADAPVATWEIEGAAVAQDGDAVTLADASGDARVRITAPEAWAAGGRPIGARLAARGATIELTVDADGDEVLVDPVWVAGPTMINKRYQFTLLVLPSGKAIAPGGWAATGGPMAAVEAFDPATNAWSPLAPMNGTHARAPTVLLPNGKVLVVGGQGGGGNPGVASAEIYDPATDKWTLAAPMSIGRLSFTATLLANGKVLAAGGVASPSLASTEIYDPATDTWTPAAPMITGRNWHTATLLPSGKVLVAGGYTNIFNATTSAEIYDPTTDTWTPAAPMAAPRAIYTATLLPSGKVLVAGGVNNTIDTAGTELYDPIADTWSSAGTLSKARSFFASVHLGGGSVIAIGGSIANQSNTYVTNCDIYDPVSNTWSPGPSLLQPRGGLGAVLLGDGRVLAAGGGSGTVQLASTELLAVGALGSACTSAAECPSGFCVDGVCCNTACDAGPCDACSVAAGAPTNGTCALLTGVACNDGDACTQSDVCQNGVCVGGNPTSCAAPDACHDDGACNATTGLCSHPAKPDGTPCPEGTCVAGACVAPPDAGTDASSTGGAGGSGTSTGGAGGGASVGGAGGGATSSSGAGGAGTGGAGVGGASSSGGGSGAVTSSGSGGSGATTTTSSGSTSSGSGGTHHDGGDAGGCGCKTSGSDASEGSWTAMGLLLLACARRRAARRSASSGARVRA